MFDEKAYQKQYQKQWRKFHKDYQKKRYARKKAEANVNAWKLRMLEIQAELDKQSKPLTEEQKNLLLNYIKKCEDLEPIWNFTHVDTSIFGAQFLDKKGVKRGE